MERLPRRSPQPGPLLRGNPSPPFPAGGVHRGGRILRSNQRLPCDGFFRFLSCPEQERNISPSPVAAIRPTASWQSVSPFPAGGVHRGGRILRSNQRLPCAGFFRFLSCTEQERNIPPPSNKKRLIQRLPKIPPCRGRVGVVHLGCINRPWSRR